MRAKLKKRGKNPRSEAIGAMLLFAFLIGVFSACNSKHKLGNSDQDTNQLSNKIENLRQQIARDNYIGTERIARQQYVDSAFLRKQEFMRIASDDELIVLASDSNAIVSLTAFQGLYSRGNSVLPTIFKGYKKRTDHIRFIRGDLMMDMPMLEYAYVYIMQYEIPDEEFPGDGPKEVPKFELSDEDQKEVVQIIGRLRPRD